MTKSDIFGEMLNTFLETDEAKKQWWTRWENADESRLNDGRSTEQFFLSQLIAICANNGISIEIGKPVNKGDENRFNPTRLVVQGKINNQLINVSDIIDFNEISPILANTFPSYKLIDLIKTVQKTRDMEPIL